MTGRSTATRIHHFGESVVIGDVNGDGIGDLLVGAPNVGGEAAAVYLLYGGGL